MNKLYYNSIIHKGEKYYYELFFNGRISDIEGNNIINKELSEIIWRKEKINSLINRIDNRIIDRRIRELYKKFPKGSVFIHDNKKYNVYRIEADIFSSAHVDIYSDNYYCIRIKRKDMIQEHINRFRIDACIPLNEYRHKKIKKLI